MCETCNQGTNIRLPREDKRRRLWEMTDGWHCSVIGTCLPLSDLRALGRKLKLKIDDSFPADYQLHGYFVQEAGRDGRAGKLLGKLLDKRHAAAIKRARPLSTDEEIAAFWAIALKSGDIPGPYWALLSHPKACPKLCERMFAEVHMLSHLAGASTRVDMRRLQELEEQNDALKHRIGRLWRRYRNRISTKNDEIRRLKDAPAVVSPAPIAVEHSIFAKVSDHENEIEMLRRATNASEAERCAQAAQIDDLNRVVAALRAENDFLEREVCGNDGGIGGPVPFDLGGRTILYVGGRKPAATRLRSLVRTWNGTLDYHDGGIEKSVNELSAAIAKADAVVFPTDCVSHDAMWKIKKLCNRSMKPYAPLRSCGVGSLIAGLQDSLSEIAFQSAAE